jgi:hypothetical protein
MLNRFAMFLINNKVMMTVLILLVVVFLWVTTWFIWVNVHPILSVAFFAFSYVVCTTFSARVKAEVAYILSQVK